MLDPRPLRTAEIVAIGTELTAGETLDTNSGEVARSLVALGMTVGRISALPDTLEIVTAGVRAAANAADVVVTTGGLGPTPDDLTREAIAAVLGETPAVDPELHAWLRGLWDRRGMPFPEMNLKQAWLIPSARSLPNPNGTAPGWWVDRRDGGVVVALPGPPREMRPMWHDLVVPALEERAAGDGLEVRTLRLAGIGESQVAERLGDALLRAANPSVATYARADAVDVRIAARAEPGANGRDRTPVEVADAVESDVLQALGAHVWARGNTTWADAIGRELEPRGWRLAIVEAATGGSLVRLLGDVPWLARAEVLGQVAASTTLENLAAAARDGVADVGIAVTTRERGGDTAVSIAVVTPNASRRERRLAFLGGSNGRTRAALVAAEVLLRALRDAAE